MTLPGDLGDRSHLAGHSPIPDQLHLAIIELSGRVNAFIQIQTIREETLNRELQRMREEKEREHRDFESRLRMLESRRYVEPKTIWTAFGMSIAAGSLIVAIINLATR